jgi:hypothetical protein
VFGFTKKKNNKIPPGMGLSQGSIKVFTRDVPFLDFSKNRIIKKDLLHILWSDMVFPG